ncbi:MULTISPECIES: hypothetical protein [unclassified Sphingobium]|uniref:hypothetical protein n=1 Tax=unclassified Sphingobium TaxID=2611147 RepID=UPI0035A611F7
MAQATGDAASSSWPTPTASDAGYVPDLIVCGGSVQPVAPKEISEGSSGQISLENATRAWTQLWLILRALGVSISATSPCSHQVRVSFTHGSKSSLAGLTCNPLFYELMMGWPIGWTGPGEPVTGFAAWLQRSRGELSRMLSDPLRGF